MNEKIEALITAYQYIPRLYKGVEDVVVEFRSMHINKANELTIQVIDGLRWLIDAIALTKEEQEPNIELEKIKEILPECIQALENEDSVLVADLFEYEVKEILQEWYDAIYTIVGKHLTNEPV